MNAKSNTYSLFVSYFHVQDKIREQELLECLERNSKNAFISKIYILYEYCKNDENFYREKLPQLVVNNPSRFDVTFVYRQRPRSISYLDFIRHANSKLDNGEKFIIANTDIYFDETLSRIIDLPQGNAIYALTRYNVEPYLSISGGVWQRSANSQDSWFFESPFPEHENFNLNLGWIGCDNRIAYELDKTGYRVLNISQTVKTWHLHQQTQHVQLYSNGYSYVFSGEPYMRVELQTLEQVLAPNYVYDNLSDLRRSTIEAQLRYYHSELESICLKYGHDFSVRSKKQTNGIKRRVKRIISRYHLRLQKLFRSNKPN